jgi:hypothetical protein
MYQHFNDFQGELNINWDKVLTFRPGWYKTYDDFKETEIEDAWNMFTNAKTGLLRELLLGDVSLRSDKPVLRNFGTTSGSETTMERNTLRDGRNRLVKVSQVTSSLKSSEKSSYTVDHGIDLIRKGSVLNDGWWWPFKNDAWVLGGVQGLKMFHLAMSSVSDDLLWDSRAGRPRVMGRELIGIHAFGYKRVAHFETDKLSGKRTEMMAGRRLVGMVFAPQNKATAEASTFNKYYSELEKYNSLQSIKDLAFATPVDYAKYDYQKVINT